MDAHNRDEIMERTKENIMEMLKKNIRPEFLNRIDETIMFTPLDEAEIKSIVHLQIESVKQLLADNGVTLIVTEKAVDYIASAGFDPEFGARPIKRAIQRYLLNDLSKQILSGNVAKESVITVDSDGYGLTFRN